MKKCVCCDKLLSDFELKFSDSIFPTCRDCDFDSLNLFHSKETQVNTFKTIHEF